jgi:sugar phosphate isomerase/epimerase
LLTVRDLRFAMSIQTAAHQTALDPTRVICSSITLRHLPLDQALDVIAGLGFTEIDLGALPGVCDHVPYELTSAAVQEVAEVVRSSGLAVRSVNADVGDLNRPLDAAAAADREEHAQRLIELCKAVDSTGLVLPNGAQQHEPIVSLDADLALVADELTKINEQCTAAGLELWLEVLHFFRLCYNLDRAEALAGSLPKDIGLICDVSHVVASGSTPREFVQRLGERITHVHLRDAEPGYIHHSIGNGKVDFADAIAALAEINYTGKYSLELETRDVSNEDRPEAALRAGRYISSLL